MVYLILIRGASGVGKSTIAQKVAKRLPGKVAFLSYDHFFFNILVNHKKMSRKYKMGVIYELTELSLQKFLKEGFSVVLEGMYLDKLNRKSVTERVCDIGRRYKVKTFVFDLLGDIKTILHRATKIRKADYDLIHEAPHHLKKSHAKFMSRLFDKAIQINTDKRSIEEVTEEIFGIIKKNKS